jgi:poly(A) polymerase
VLYRLKEAGYQGFLVGGAVRDLLLGLRPKDFDVATDALPEEVRRLFRNCRLIGRRFRLAHVFFGNEIIEVATFRAAAAPEREDAEDLDAEGGSDAGTEGGADGADSRVDEPAEFSPPADSEHRAFDTRGRILRDNIYGTIEEDVWRRDFAANGLYYNIEDFSIWDFVDGVNDVKARRLTMIGDPETRYREDPVRMLRAVRFAAKLDFSIEPNTEAPIKRLAYMLDGVPPARLFDEVLKLFLSGFGEKAYELLQRYGLFEHLFPQSAAAFAMPPYAYAADMLKMGLENSDSVLRTQQSRVSIPRRFSIPMRELLMLQPRFNRRSGVKSLSLLQHPRFRAAYDFLLLRAQAGVADPELAKWWTDIQVLPQEERVALVQARPPEPAAEGAPAPGRRRRRRRRGGAARS